jgi:hypothetical protein
MVSANPTMIITTTMKRLALVLLFTVSVFLSQGDIILAKGGGSSHSKSSSSSSKSTVHSSSGTHHGGKQKAVGVHRDKKGKIARSAKAKDEFKKAHPCPSTGKTSGSCPGYVIDHVTALKRGGQDSPYNMQWQTKQDAKAKDKWE